MRIECKSCGASGNFDESRLPAGGANVKCPRCKEKIWVSPDGSPPYETCFTPCDTNCQTGFCSESFSRGSGGLYRMSAELYD
jgi:predicted Zn finger-like uncharacterized protein